jgi:hypothetical protein
MEREYIAYLLIVAMMVAAVGGVFVARYHSDERTYRRRVKRESAAHSKLMSARRKPGV